MATTIMTDKKVLARAIGAIKRSKIDQQIHAAGLSCMYHMMKHGDVGFMERLIDVMPKSSRREGFYAWMEAHCPATIDRAEGKVKLKKERTEADFLIDAADAVPFWDFTKERKVSEVSLDSILQYLKRLAEGGTEAKPASDEAKEMAHLLMASFRDAKTEMERAALERAH